LAGEGANTGPDRGRDDDLLAAVRAFQRGQQGGFDPLYRQLWGPVALRASRMGLGPHEAEEIAQRTLVRVYLYAARASFDRPEQIWGWVYTIASREVYKLWRKKRPDVVAPEALEAWASVAADPSASPAAAAASAEAVADIRRCLAELDEADRMVILGVLVGGLTFRGAARAHGLSLGQFKHRYERTLRKVRQCMRAKGHDVE
jgi:RNA polymerase sigma factor (sigma-70 family)